MARTSGGNPLVTTYSYDANTGEQTGIDYSDSTQDISFSYTRTGQQYQVTDSVGTRTFAYNATLQPSTETITGGLYSKTITRDYAASGVVGRNIGLHISTEYDLDYAYDTYGRFSTITNGGDVYTYGYLANSDLIASLTYPNDIKTDNTYEAHRNLVTQVKNTYDTSTTISQYDYTYDAIGRRSDVDWSGTAFTASDTITYGYNDRNEITSADATSNANYNFSFSFDNIGNRSSYTTYETGSSVISAYTVNNLNQYTAITNPSQSPTYDDDGDMISDGTWSFTWNAENRLIVAEKADAKLEFKYDYMGRRVEKKVYSGSTGNWTLDTHLKFLYDGFEQIEVLDGADSDAILKKRIWGLNKLICDIHSSTAYYALGDANKNISEYLDSSGNIQAHCEYSPFGKIIAKTGTKQNDFDFRFSSEVADSETGLVYYNYRYYSSLLGRWLSRDPIAEAGGYNLYGMVHNNPVDFWDILGKDSYPEYSNPSGSTDWSATLSSAVRAGVDALTGTSITNLVTGDLEQQARNEHYNRNNNNVTPSTSSNAKNDNWTQLSQKKSIYHTQGIDGEGNTKWISPDGHHEAVYDNNGNLVTNSLNQGTYNYYNPLENPIAHAIEDVLPYMLWGNDEDDPTNVVDRIYRGVTEYFWPSYNPTENDPTENVCPACGQ